MTSSTHKVMTTDAHGNDRPLMVWEIYGSVLPNTIQNALFEALSTIEELNDAIAPDMKTASERSELLEFLEASARLIAISPVLQADIPFEVEAPMLTTLKLLHKERIALLQRLRNPASDTRQCDVIAA